MSEHTEQCAVVEWLEWNHIPFYAVPNGGKRDKITAKRLKDEGVRSGVPDLCIPVPKGEKHGLYVEMKIQGGSLSKAQKEWINYLVSVGYECAVCYGAEAAIKAIRGYMSGRNNNQSQER